MLSTAKLWWTSGSLPQNKVTHNVASMAVTSSKFSMTAREVIDDIREELGVGEGILQEIASNKRIQRAWNNQQSLTQNAVKELSTGLYQEDTHFIMELIQNADDNKYEDAIEPTVAFTVTPGFIRVDCNECGFSERDVRAICFLGKSTKKAQKVEGYIGEKGIGFKSVFKVAQIVHVKSADYTFKFDTTLPELGSAGMLAPTWSPFPHAETVTKYTQMLLELSPQYDAGELKEKFGAFQTTLLLFLRRLRRIEINTSSGSRVFTRQDHQDESKVVLRELFTSPLTSVPSVSTTEYLLISHILHDLPTEPKRSGVNSTEISLAFPVQNEDAVATKQLLYAFLPVKHFGFNFLVQADFLLSSSREDIQECAWNRRLRAGIQEAFCKAVSRFNTIPFLIEWHEDLCTVLVLSDAIRQDPTKLGKIALIPLRDGTWAPAPSRYSAGIYFQNEIAIPSGIAVRVVDPDASKHRERRALFELLGVKPCNPGEVCKEIQRAHRSGNCDHLGETELRSHAYYLCAHADQCPELDFNYICLLDTISSPRYCSELYVELPGSVPLLSTLFEGPFIHPAYINLLPRHIKQRQWLHWLTHELQVSCIPRIKESGQQSLSLSFQTIIKSSPSWILLKILTENWLQYSPQLTKEIKEKLSSTLVTCVPCGSRALRDTILPLPSLTKLSHDHNVTDLPFLDIGEMRDDAPSLLFLEAFGVTIRDDEKVYTSILKTFSCRGGIVEMDKVCSIYRSLQYKCQNFSALQALMNEHPLVFVPATSPDRERWVRLKDCVWKSPSCIQSKFALSSHYSSLHGFFNLNLQVKNATLSLLVDDIIRMTRSKVNLNHIDILKAMVLGMQGFLKKKAEQNTDTQLLRLQETAYLPVHESALKTTLLTSSRDKFFIPDRKELLEAFGDDLPILDFTVDEVRHMKPLLENLGMSGKFLSHCVEEAYDLKGAKKVDDVATRSLRTKNHALYSCALHYKSPRAISEDSILPEQLSKLVVTRVEKFNLIRRVSSQGFRKTNSSPAHVHFEEAGGMISIFLPRIGENWNGVIGYWLPRLLVQWLQIKNAKEAESIFKDVLLQSGAMLSKVLDDADISLTKIEEWDAFEEKFDFGPADHLGQMRSTVAKPNGKNIVFTQSNAGANGTQQQPSQFTSRSVQSIRPGSTIGSMAHGATFSTPSGTFSDDHVSDTLPVTSMFFHRAFPHLHDRMKDLTKNASQAAKGVEVVTNRIPPTEMKTEEPSSLAVERSELQQRPREPSMDARLDSGADVLQMSQKTEAQHQADLGTGFLGEYYVVESFRQLLKDFEPNLHWTSVLRGWAQSYDNYGHLTNYTIPEVSDITYKDSKGWMSQWLVSKDCSQAKDWLKALPTYHIEVKTTTESCKEPFNMSQYQVQLARDMSAIDKFAPEKVYIIIRVFDILRSPAFRLYVDPWSLIQDGSLELIADEYLVEASL